MRLILFYDLPTRTKLDISQASIFRNFLIKLGFIMMQESIYVKHCLIPEIADKVTLSISNNLPKSGDVRLLRITEKQYDTIMLLKGKKSINELANSDEELIVI